MTEIYSLSEGELPLLVSIPHDGRQLAPGQAQKMTTAAQALPDTDWHVRQLYQFAEVLGANIIAANFSRYVVDLNRAADNRALYEGQVSTGLCPIRTFVGDDVYKSGDAVSAQEQQQRVHDYWQPYHEQIAATLAAIRERFGYALLWDAHSIASEVPLLFPGVLPDLNLGTNSGESCPASVIDAVMSEAERSDYSAVLNDRFRGGYITRNYGSPDDNIHAVQLELSQRIYMNEKNMRYDSDGAARLEMTIKRMLDAFVNAAEKHQRQSEKGGG